MFVYLLKLLINKNDKDMTAQILKQHGIKVKIENNSIYALEVAFYVNTKETTEEWINVTKWSKNKLYNWLGY